MPNWTEGTIKLRGKKENVVLAIKEMFSNDNVEIFEDEDDIKITNNKSSILCINNTRRAFIDEKEISIYFSGNDIEMIEIENFKQAWCVIPENYIELSKKYDIDIKIFAFEMGMEFTQEVEIIKGEITKNKVFEYDDYFWEVPFSSLGG